MDFEKIIQNFDKKDQNIKSFDDSMSDSIYRSKDRSKKSKGKNKNDDEINSHDPFTGSRTAYDPKTKLFTALDLSPDYNNRPLYVCPDGHIFLETFSKYYQPAYEFMVAIAEPVSRPKYIQEYQINTYSLYTAVSIGLTDSEIIRVLGQLSKCEIAPELKKLIENTVATVGKLKLILKNKRYFVQSTQLSLLQKVARRMDHYRIFDKNKDDIYDPDTGFIIPNDELSSIDVAGIGNADEYGSTSRITDEIGIDISDLPQQAETMIRRFEIKPECVPKARHKALKMNIPFSDEYDFRSDTDSPDLPIDLKKATAIRPYQERALSKMFNGGRAKSGVIVLPCGAGKTLVGITATCTIRKSTIIFCNSTYLVHQWRAQFFSWITTNTNTDIDNYIYLFTAKNKPSISPDKPIILITTYSIFTSGKAEQTQILIDQLTSREWGLMIMDEVQEMVAEQTREVVKRIKAHAKLGLTATLVREDDNILDLNYLIGPRLYEANWIDLANQGYIARVKCYEVWCKMTGPFYKHYLLAPNKGRLYSALNPNKFNAVERLIKYHEKLGHKILVFADILYALHQYYEYLKQSDSEGPKHLRRVRPILEGCVSEEERSDVFYKFKTSDTVSCIFISKIGDKAIDLPDANVLIQICSNYGARMQEAQRLGRILRKKAGRTGEYNAFFYTIISEDTREMYFSMKRQRFLIDQGYVYEVVKEDKLREGWPVEGSMVCDNEAVRTTILEGIKKTNVDSAKVDNSDDDS